MDTAIHSRAGVEALERLEQMRAAIAATDELTSAVERIVDEQPSWPREFSPEERWRVAIALDLRGHPVILLTGFDPPDDSSAAMRLVAALRADTALLLKEHHGGPGVRVAQWTLQETDGHGSYIGPEVHVRVFQIARDDQ